MWDMITRNEMDNWPTFPTTGTGSGTPPYWARPEPYEGPRAEGGGLLTLRQFIDAFEEHGRIFHPVGGGLEEVRRGGRMGVRVVFYPMGRDEDEHARWAVQFNDTGRVAAIFVDERSPANRSEDKKGERHE